MKYVVPQAKIVSYLLANPKKSAFLLPLGYSVENWTILRDDMLRIAENFPHHLRANTPHGDAYDIIGDVVVPNGRTVKIRTGWMIKKGQKGIMSFVTAYPAKVP
jgi:hypothetical protein